MFIKFPFQIGGRDSFYQVISCKNMQIDDSPIARLQITVFLPPCLARIYIRDKHPPLTLTQTYSLLLKDPNIQILIGYPLIIYPKGSEQRGGNLSLPSEGCDPLGVCSQ
jgi:hypothetical protein